MEVKRDGRLALRLFRGAVSGAGPARSAWVPLAGRTDEWVWRYWAGAGPASGGFLAPAAVAAGLGAGFAGFGGG